MNWAWGVEDQETLLRLNIIARATVVLMITKVKFTFTIQLSMIPRFLPPASVDVIINQPCLYMCSSGFLRQVFVRYRTTMCTIELHCAPPTCVVHHGTQGRPIYVVDNEHANQGSQCSSVLT